MTHFVLLGMLVVGPLEETPLTSLSYWLGKSHIIMHYSMMHYSIMHDTACKVFMHACYPISALNMVKIILITYLSHSQP